MRVNDKEYLQKKEFVSKLNEAFILAKPHLRCEFLMGSEIENKNEYDEYVVVTASNGYKYYINVSCSSLVSIGEEIFRTMLCK